MTKNTNKVIAVFGPGLLSDDQLMKSLKKEFKVIHYQEIESLNSKLDKLKQDSLYVDIKDGFIPLSPDLITKEVSEFYLEFAERRLKAVMSVFL